MDLHRELIPEELTEAHYSGELQELIANELAIAEAEWEAEHGYPAPGPQEAEG